MKHLKLYEEFNNVIEYPKLTIPKLFNIEYTLNCFSYAKSSQLKNTLKLGLKNSKYIAQYNILYSYYLWLLNNQDKFFITRDTIKHLSLKNYIRYPIQYICFYLKLDTFEFLLDLRHDEKWWLKSFNQLINVKELDGINDQAIIEEWLLGVSMAPNSISRQHIILLDIYGKRLYKYLSEQSRLN